MTEQEPLFKISPEKRLIGKRIRMSLAMNSTGALWRAFMPERRRILNAKDETLYSVEIYPARYFDAFEPDAVFEKWAAVEVAGEDPVPEGMESLIIPEGFYAVFVHKGPASHGAQTLQYIFGTWIPASGYSVDDRPHFEVMDEKYKNESPDSEEALWVPVKKKA